MQAIRLLLALGARASANKRGLTPLHLAASLGQAESVSTLLTAGHPIGETDGDGG